MQKTKKMKHNYTSETELKSLLIRIKNKSEDKGTLKENAKINKYIKWHKAINLKKYEFPTRKNIIKNKIKDKIVTLSELTCCDDESYEKFGSIIILMIDKILTKPQFSGYSYRDDFYSDAIYKILKYINNYNHKLISKITDQPVNAFSYISQIIHMSIIFIIKSKNKETEKLKILFAAENLFNDRSQYQSKNNDGNNDSLYHEEPIIHEGCFYITEIENTLSDEIEKLNINIKEITHLEIFYPKTYNISFDEYNNLRSKYKGKISILRRK